jgi:hypothetical protein
MWLQALLTAEDITAALAEVTPLRIALDDEAPDRYLWLTPPSSVRFVPERGIRVIASARLQWDVVGITVPLTIRVAEVLLRPFVEQVNGEDVLRFQAEIERLDLSHVPSLVEGPIIARLNAKLAEPASYVSWNFMQTLDFDFKMPKSVAPLEKLRLFARWGAVRIQEDGLTLAVAFGFEATRDRNALQGWPAELAGTELEEARPTEPG